MFIVDAHLDLAYNALNHKRDLTQELDTLRAKERRSHDPVLKINGTAVVTLPELRRAGVGLVFGSLFVAPASRRPLEPGSRFIYSQQMQAHDLAMEQLDYYHRLADEVSYVRLVIDQKSLNEVINSQASDEDSLLGIVPMMEGADAIREPAEAEMWFERGLRIIALAWDDTRYSAGAWQGIGGLTDDGRHLMEIMADLGFILDLTHMSEEATLQALDSYQGQIMASHSNARALVGTQRQLSDQQIRLIAERDGVIGVVLYNKFLKARHEKGDPKEAVTVQYVTAHIDHICQRVGSAQYVGIGSDYGGTGPPKGLETAAQYPNITEALLKRGYDEKAIIKILGGNLMRIMEQVQAAAK